MCVIAYLGSSGICLCVCRDWRACAICRCRSTHQTTVFVRDSRDVNDINAREYIDLGWCGTSRGVKCVQKVASRGLRTWSIQRV